MKVYHVHVVRCVKFIFCISFILLSYHFFFCWISIDVVDSNIHHGQFPIVYGDQILIKQHFRQSLASFDPLNSEEPKKRTVVISEDFFKFLVNNLGETPFPSAHFYTEYNVARSAVKPITHVQPLRSDFGPVLNDVTSFKYIINTKSCLPLSSVNKAKMRRMIPSLFVAVISAPSYFEKRQSIRETWRKHLFEHHSDVHVSGFAFILGSPQGEGAVKVQKAIEEENRLKGDIIQVDMADAYHNLTTKVAALLNWIDGHCQGVDFVLKVDDDVYVNVRNLVSVLKSLSPSNQFIYGTHLNNTLTPLRNGKWGVGYDVWPWSTYPPFLIGAGVLLAGGTIHDLLAATQTTPFFVWDDTYLFGICVKKADLQIYSSDGFFDIQPTYPLDECFASETITWLTTSTQQMKESQTAVKDFFSGRRKCITLNEAESKVPKITDPKQTTNFSFELVPN